MDKERKLITRTNGQKLAQLAKAGAIANDAVRILIKDANYVPEELLELKDISMGASKVLAGPITAPVVAAFPEV